MFLFLVASETVECLVWIDEIPPVWNNTNQKDWIFQFYLYEDVCTVEQFVYKTDDTKMPRILSRCIDIIWMKKFMAD